MHHAPGRAIKRTRATALATAALATVLAATAPAAAQSAPDRASQSFSLTISPFHLVLPVVELQAELRVSSLVGIALIGGYGNVSAETSSGDTIDFSVLELGAQAIIYPLADFESLQLGAELLYLRLSVEDGQVVNEQVDALASGVFLGPLVGYKLMTVFGFTLFVQGGLGFVIVEANAESSSGETATKSDSTITPLLNFNLGWSF